MGVSPTKTGEMRQDQFWLLKSRRTWAYYDNDAGCPVEPVTTEPVEYDVYRNAGNTGFLHAWNNIRGITIHGRRVNDEVELFEWDGGKETPGLREALEAKGLTVRTYVPEKKNKFPKANYKSVLGWDAEPHTPLENCVHTLKKSLKDLETIEDLEKKLDSSTNCVVLAETSKNGEKTMLVCKLREKEFYEYYNNDDRTLITAHDEQYRIIGTVDCGDVHLRCDEETFVSFFKVKLSEGNLRVDLVPVRLDKEHAEMELDSLKAEKKLAKKHRRRVTASTVTSPSEKSMASSLTEADEHVKARQREKQKAKKKAQKERRQARVSEKEEWERTVVAALTTNGNNKTKDAVDNNGEVTLELVGDSGSYVIFRNENTGKHRVLSKPGYEILDSSEIKEKTEPSSRKYGSSGESDASSDTEPEGGMQIVEMSENSTPADITRIVQAFAGSPIMVTSLEEESEERESAASKGLRYLGRGL